MDSVVSWDLVLALSQFGLDICLLPTVFKQSYVPRFTSGSTAFDLSIVALALLNIGAPLGAISALSGVVLWSFIYAYRGKRKVS